MFRADVQLQSLERSLLHVLISSVRWYRTRSFLSSSARSRCCGLVRATGIDEGQAADSSLCLSQPAHKTFKIKKILAKKARQNRQIPQWIRLRTDNKIRCQTQPGCPSALMLQDSTYAGQTWDKICTGWLKMGRNAMRERTASCRGDRGWTALRFRECCKFSCS